MKNLIKILSTLVILFAIACTKEGPQGPAGTNGNANVIYSSWVTISGTTRDTTVDGSKHKIKHFIADSLTADNLSNAAILSFFKIPGDENIYPLPYTSYAGGIANTISTLPSVGKLFITRFTHDNSGSIGISSSLQYRYIIIPGSKNLRLAKPLKNMSYDEICKMYDITQ